MIQWPAGPIYFMSRSKDLIEMMQRENNLYFASILPLPTRMLPEIDAGAGR